MWLLAEETLRDMQRLERSGMTPSAVQQEAFEQRVAARSSPPNLTTAGSVAEIAVEGVLTKRPNFWATLFGGGNTAYTDIQMALSIAKNDPAIKSVVFRIDSPGGHVDGLFDALGAIQAFPKPMSVRASNAQSAAFAIAAVAGKIEALGSSSTFGSIGTAIDFVMWNDVEIVSITNTDSPDKRPDPKTEDGRRVIVQYLDAVNDLFVSAIADGRGVKKKAVSEDYGRGATLLAGEAKRRGMIDSIRKQPELRVVGADAAQPTEVATMDLKTLKAQHPELCEALAAEGKKTEFDRVIAHLTWGEKANAMDIAVKAIRSGELVTQTLLAEYMTSGMNRRDVQNRQQESDQAGASLGGAAGGTTAPVEDVGDKAAAIMAARRGKKLVAHG